MYFPTTKERTYALNILENLAKNFNAKANKKAIMNINLSPPFGFKRALEVDSQTLWVIVQVIENIDDFLIALLCTLFEFVRIALEEAWTNEFQYAFQSMQKLVF